MNDKADILFLEVGTIADSMDILDLAFTFNRPKYSGVKIFKTSITLLKTSERLLNSLL